MFSIKYRAIKTHETANACLQYCQTKQSVEVNDELHAFCLGYPLGRRPAGPQSSPASGKGMNISCISRKPNSSSSVAQLVEQSQ
jgi:hypothetical protein